MTTTRKIEDESFEAGYGKAVELIGKVAHGLPRGVPGYCKGGALAHLTNAYAVVYTKKGKAEACAWLASVLELMAGDIKKTYGVQLRIAVKS